VALEDRLLELAEEIPPPDEAAAEEARRRHLGLTKPPGSLGRLEVLGERLAGMAGECPPFPESPAVVVCAGDHGVLERGVSPWPQEITAAMVGNFCTGGAAVNAIAKTVGARVSVLDVGVAGELERHPLLRAAKVRRGTDDLSRGPAMTREEAARAVMAGAGIAEELVESGGVDLLVTGDMGIGNTTPAACLISAFTGSLPEETTGRGTGIDDQTLKLKVNVVEEALGLHAPDPEDPLGVLAQIGGLEHAAIVGVILAGAVYRIPVILDGVVSNSAALVARVLASHSAGYVIAGHRSTEPGARIVLDHLELEPLLDLDMRLGEGIGGLLAVPLVQAAARTLNEMATLEELGVG
jgi:nicotinate-nucleotide--dimethylbenzimidazole phosphoribosyltransferase